jgi:hypothetical protein
MQIINSSGDYYMPGWVKRDHNFFLMNRIYEEKRRICITLILQSHLPPEICEVILDYIPITMWWINYTEESHMLYICHDVNHTGDLRDYVDAKVQDDDDDYIAYRKLAKIIKSDDRIKIHPQRCILPNVHTAIVKTKFKVEKISMTVFEDFDKYVESAKCNQEAYIPMGFKDVDEDWDRLTFRPEFWTKCYQTLAAFGTYNGEIDEIYWIKDIPERKIDYTRKELQFKSNLHSYANKSSDSEAYKEFLAYLSQSST